MSEDASLRTLITGGAGFVGSHLCERFLQLGHEVICVDNYITGNPINIEIPSFVEYTITRCDPGLKGDTAQGATKPATLETGAVVQVPLFVKEGERIRVDTRSGEYFERVN